MVTAEVVHDMSSVYRPIVNDGRRRLFLFATHVTMLTTEYDKKEIGGNEDPLDEQLTFDFPSEGSLSDLLSTTVVCGCPSTRR